jgi:ATP-binding cassette subfamily C protein CydD
MRTLRIAIMSSFALDFFTTLSVAVVAVFLGLALLEGQTVLLPALTILVLAPEYFMPLRNFADDYHATLDGKNALTDVYALLDTPSPKAQDQQQVPHWQANSQLVVEDLKVVHEDAQTTPALHDINLTVTGHQKIAIVGTSGAGKTTLMQVLAGFMAPTAGQFRIDDQMMKHLAQPSWQSQFFYMPQKPYIFHASLRDNIRFYAPQASHEAVVQAVKQAGLTDLMTSLPDGLDTLIGEGGRQLSGGQAQRVALARMLVDNQRDILLFDEPTAHLDVATEADLKQTMMPLFDQKLVLFATHRLHWLQQMDYVVVLDQGTIVETGAPQTLLADANSRLNQLRAQLKGERPHAE